MNLPQPRHSRPTDEVSQPGPVQMPRLPAGEQAHRELSIWGAHGGTGTSTLAAWLWPARDLGAMRDGPGPACPSSIAARRALVITCRNTAWSAARATIAVAAVTRRGGHVAVLAVVSDGWPEPERATTRFGVLEPHVSAVVRIPFVAGLRPADDPATVTLPGKALRALAEILAVTDATLPRR